MKSMKNIKKFGKKNLIATLAGCFLLTGCCDIPLVPFVKNNIHPNQQNTQNIEKNASQNDKNQV